MVEVEMIGEYYVWIRYGVIFGLRKEDFEAGGMFSVGG